MEGASPQFSECWSFEISGHGQIQPPPPRLVWQSLGAKNDSHIFQQWRKKQKKNLFCDTRKLYEIQISESYMKLEHSQAHTLLMGAVHHATAAGLS